MSSIEPTSLALGLLGGIVLASVVGRLLAIWLERRVSASGSAQVLTPRAQIREVRELLAIEVAKNARIQAEQATRLDEFKSAYEQRAKEIHRLQDDVRDAVAKTRELREELIERATEAKRAEALGDDSPTDIHDVGHH